MNSNKIHMHDQVSKKVDGIMSFYKRSPNKALLFFHHRLIKVLFIVSAVFLIMTQIF